MGEIANSVNLLEIEREDNSIALWPTVSLITAGDRISIYSVNKPSMLVGNCGLPYPCLHTWSWSLGIWGSNNKNSAAISDAIGIIAIKLSSVSMRLYYWQYHKKNCSYGWIVSFEGTMFICLIVSRFTAWISLPC